MNASDRYPVYPEGEAWISERISPLDWMVYITRTFEDVINAPMVFEAGKAFLFCDFVHDFGTTDKGLHLDPDELEHPMDKIGVELLRFNAESPITRMMGHRFSVAMMRMMYHGVKVGIKEWHQACADFDLSKYPEDVERLLRALQGTFGTTATKAEFEDESFGKAVKGSLVEQLDQTLFRLDEVVARQVSDLICCNYEAMKADVLKYRMESESLEDTSGFSLREIMPQVKTLADLIRLSGGSGEA